MINKLKQMMEQLINGEYDCNAFSYDFPDEMYELDDEKALDILDDMPEICAAYDPYKNGEDGTLNDKEFINEVKKIYKKLIEAGY